MPLPASEFQILLALADGPLHGLGISAEITARTDGEIRLGPGTLYTSIKRMLAQRLIAVAIVSGDPRRRCYRLTAAGFAAVREESLRLEALVRTAQRKGLIGPKTA